MTYLQLINKVLVRLRQTTVASLAEAGATLNGHFVNQAKEEIEDMGPWISLRAEGLITTVANTATASITTATTNERSYVYNDDLGPQIFETTTNGVRRRMTLVDREVLRAMKEQDTTQTAARPQYIAFDKSASGMTAHFYPTPDAVYTFKVVVVTPQAELTVASTALTIPSKPVWMLAAAYAAIERGEELSGEPNGLMAQARIAIDATVLHDFGSEEHTFYVD